MLLASPDSLTIAKRREEGFFTRGLRHEAILGPPAHLASYPSAPSHSLSGRVVLLFLDLQWHWGPVLFWHRHNSKVTRHEVSENSLASRFGGSWQPAEGRVLLTVAPNLSSC